VVKEQVALYGTLTGETRPEAEPERQAAPAEGGEVVPMPPRRREDRRAGP
jgi:hypothetical protein